MTCNRDVAVGQAKTEVVHRLPLAVSREMDAVQILGHEGLVGTERTWADLIDCLIERNLPDLLALEFVAEAIRELFDGDIRVFLKEGKEILDEVRAVLDQHHDHSLDPKECSQYALDIP